MPAGTRATTDEWDPRAEREVIARAAAGDIEAFHDVYVANVADVSRFLARRVPRSDVEDLTAEVFLRAYRNIDRYEWRGTPIRAWLVRIALNLVIGQGRKAPREPVLTDRPVDAPSVSAEVVALDRLESDDLVAALRHLNEQQRTVLELRYLRSFSVRETAVTMNISEEAARALAYRSLRSLRRVLSESEGTAGVGEPGS